MAAKGRIKKSAFGKDENYADHVLAGANIAANRDEVLFAKYIKQLAGADKVLSQQAATVLHHVSNEDASFFVTFTPTLVEVLKNPVHDSGPRMIFRVFRKIEIPEKNLGTIIDLCFKYLNNPKTAVAIKVNAMYVIARFFDNYPDLKKEFNAATKNNASKDLPAFKSCLKLISK